MTASIIITLAAAIFVLIHIGAIYFTWRRFSKTAGKRERISLLFDLFLFLAFAWVGLVFVFRIYLWGGLPWQFP